MVRLSLLRPGSAGRTHQKKSRGRARAIATTGVLCSPALGESDTYPAVSGGAGGAENRNAPNGTAALSFVANSEAARYVFVVVAAADVMDRGRRNGAFVLACFSLVGKARPSEPPPKWPVVVEEWNHGRLVGASGKCGAFAIYRFWVGSVETENEPNIFVAFLQ